MDDEELIDDIIRDSRCFNSSAKLLHAFAKVSSIKSLFSSSGRAKVSIEKGPSSVPTKRCFNFNGIGHFAAGCRKPKPEYGACYACGGKDHLVYNCTERKFVSNNEFVRPFEIFFGSEPNQ